MMTAGNATMAVWVAASFIMSLRFILFPLLRAFLAWPDSDAHTFKVLTCDASIFSTLDGRWARSDARMRLRPTVQAAFSVFALLQACACGLAQQPPADAVTSVASAD